MTNERTNQLKMLCSFFNMKAGTHCWANSGKTIEIADRAFNLANDNYGEIKEFLRAKVQNGEKDFRKALEDYVSEWKNPEQDVKVPTPEVVAAPVQTSAPVDNLTASMNFMGQVVMELLAKTKTKEIRDAVSESLREDVKQFIYENYGTIQRKVEVITPERKVELNGVLHSKFDDVLKLVSLNIPVFLTGPAGSGKNVICQQVAKALGLNFYFSNAVTQEYKLTGFTDANGVYQESQFYKAFKNGGVFMLDEMDASIPEVLVILNAALANRYFDFPAPIGYVEAHPDFRVIAAGNTFGQGADYTYVGRNQLDGASLDRFFYMTITYDERIEEACANGDADLLKFCRMFRTATQSAGIRAIVSYRAITYMAKLSANMDAKDVLNGCLIKSLEVDDLNAIKSSISGCGKWSTAFKELVAERERV